MGGILLFDLCVIYLPTEVNFFQEEWCPLSYAPVVNQERPCIINNLQDCRALVAMSTVSVAWEVCSPDLDKLGASKAHSLREYKK